MDYWEFLIQQEGDQTWLPLETKQVEILEGRYRLAAHTSRVNTPLEIRVSQLVTDEIPPRRRVRKRRGKTNAAGLVVIFPFLQLKSGTWDVHCSGTDVMNDLLGAGWHHAVKLQVLPRTEEADVWEPDWSTAAGEKPPERSSVGVLDELAEDVWAAPAAPVTETVAQRLLSDLLPVAAPGSLTDQGAGDRLDRSDQGAAVDPSAETLRDDISEERPSLSTEVLAASNYRVQLQRQAYVIQPGQSLALSGQVSVVDASALTAASLEDLEFFVQLRNPQTAQILMESRHPFSPSALPADFSVSVTPPVTAQTRVVLGGLVLRYRADDPTAPALALSSFTTTIGIDLLLDAIANQDDSAFDEETSVFPGSTEPFSLPSEPISALIAPELALETPSAKRLSPSEGLILPPKLYEPDGGTDRAPELPLFPKKTSPQPQADSADESVPEPLATTPADVSEVSEALRSPAVFESDSVEDDDLEAELAAAAQAADAPDLAGRRLSALAEADVSEAAADEAADAIEDGDLEDGPEPGQAEAEAFQSLNLQARFWQRLSSLTQEGYQAASELRQAMEAAGVLRPVTESTGTLEAVGPPEPVGPTELTDGVDDREGDATDEVVVYEEPVITPEAQPQPPELPPLNPPILEVPGHDLTAGDLITLGIRLLPGGYRPYVKVWMNDLQTRRLIEEPRLLMQLTPNDRGELETFMRVQIPQGCLELQFAAIAIDMATLQESRKVVINRRIIPGELPTLSLDDFDL